MKNSPADRRTSKRFTLRLPMLVGDVHIEAETRDVSTGGVSFYTDQQLLPGTSIEFAMTLPSSLTATEDVQVLCQGEVVRAEEQSDGRMVVAARIKHYHFADDDRPEPKTSK